MLDFLNQYVDLMQSFAIIILSASVIFLAFHVRYK